MSKRLTRKQGLDILGTAIILICLLAGYKAIRYAYTTDYENCIARGTASVFTDMDAELLVRGCAVPFTNSNEYRP